MTAELKLGSKPHGCSGKDGSGEVGMKAFVPGPALMLTQTEPHELHFHLVSNGGVCCCSSARWRSSRPGSWRFIQRVTIAVRPAVGATSAQPVIRPTVAKRSNEPRNLVPRAQPKLPNLDETVSKGQPC